jgi:hypothetical protein
VEPESYLDMAVTKWLPRRWECAECERAVEALAVRIEDRHHDRWLHDMLASRRSEALVRSQADLAAAAEANLSDESDLALRKSVNAANGFRSAGNRAGALRAGFEQIYAIHRS